MSYTKIGIIVNTHGLKGTVKVKSFTDFKDERYQKGNQLMISYNGKEIFVTVEKYKTVKSVEHIDFKEFTNINEVEKFKGSELFIHDEYIHELDEDEFYFDELIGMTVLLDDQKIGIVKDVQEMPRNAMLVIQRDNEKNALVPFLDEFVDIVDKENNTITLKYWEGLL